MDIMEFEQLINSWYVIAEECKKLSKEKIMDVSALNSREDVADALLKDGLQWIKGWDGYDNWINWGIALNHEFPFDNAGLPRTVQLLKRVNGLKFAALSILKAGAVIPIHSHPEMIKENLITFHLGLDVPPNCFLNVNGEFMPEENGKGIIFNGALPHYAFNASGQDRLILHCEVSPYPQNSLH